MSIDDERQRTQYTTGYNLNEGSIYKLPDECLAPAVEDIIVITQTPCFGNPPKHKDRKSRNWRKENQTQQ